MAEPKNTLDRRMMVAGVGAVGALAVVGAVVARKSAAVPVAAAAPQAQPPADTAGGYRLSEHVKHYYRTARI